MATLTSKLPTSSQPLVQDLDLAAALERVLAPYEGKRLERAQAAVRKVATSDAHGPFATLLAVYTAAVQAATGGDRET